MVNDLLIEEMIRFRILSLIDAGHLQEKRINFYDTPDLKLDIEIEPQYIASTKGYTLYTGFRYFRTLLS